MLFTGEHEHTIDAKQRLAIPAEFRSELESEEGQPVILYLTPGPNGVPWIYPKSTFIRLAEASKSSFLPANEMMEFETFFYSQSNRLEMDSSGRIRIPERRLKAANLGKSVMILGSRDHLELWDPQVWADTLQRQESHQPELILRAKRVVDEQESKQ